MNKNNLLLAVVLLLSAAGCSKSLSYEYSRERSEKDYQRAIEEFNAGNVDGALKLLSDAIKASPSNASARFQFALILQDSKKDYLEAYCNFAEYLRIAGESDKVSLARERLVQCRERIVSAGNRASDPAVLKELESARADLLKAEKNVAELTAQRDKLVESAKKMQRKIDHLSKTIKGFGDMGDDPAALRPSAVRRADDDVSRAGSQEYDANASEKGSRRPGETLSAASDKEREKPLRLNPEARALSDEEDQELSKKAGSDLLPRSDVKKAGDAKAAANTSTPGGFYRNDKQEQRPEFYVVREGEGLMQIAKRFYGDRGAWKKIRDANKATVGPSGHVRAGQKLRLP